MKLNKIPPLLFVLGAVIIALIAYLLLSIYEQRHTRLPVLGPQTETAEGKVRYHSVPAFLFTDQDGMPFGSDSVESKIFVANYFFTSCPTICPAMTENLKKLQDKIGKMDDVEILSFTVDPRRDNPERLREYAEKYNANHAQWHFLTGEKKDLYLLARKGFFLSATDGDGGQYDFIHSENFVLVDHEGRIRGFYDGTKDATVDQLLIDIKKLRNSRS